MIPPPKPRLLVSLLVKLTSPFSGWLCPKGQVTRAQEAEENYLIKRELATVKQQSEEASAQLEQAMKAIRQLQQQQPQAVRRARRRRWHVAPELLWYRRFPDLLGRFMIISSHRWCSIFKSVCESARLSPHLGCHALPSNSLRQSSTFLTFFFHPFL